MNVGIVSTWFERGAAYVSRQYLKAIQTDPDNKVFVYARSGESYGKNQSDWDKEFVTWGKISKKYYSGDIGLIVKKDFTRWLTKNRIDIVLFNEQNWWPPVVWCKELGIKTGTYVDYYKEDTVPFFAMYDYIFCNTHRHYQLFKDIPQTYFIPWGTETDVFNVKRQKNDVLTFFHSAGMNPKRKGTDTVINAFLRLPKGHQAKLLIHTQRKLETCLEHFDPSIYHHPDIEIRTATIPAPGLYGLGDVYVYPSILDGLGLTVVEALSCGLPCIVSNHAPMNEFIQDGVNGKLVDIEYLYSRSDGYFWPQCKVSTDSLVEQMMYYIKHFSDLRAFQEQARLGAVKDYDWGDRSEMICITLKNVKAKPFDKALANRIKQHERKKNGKYNLVPYLFYFFKKLM